MKEQIPVSVIMPVYNAEKYLPEAIESVLNQTYRNFEFIIVENASIDRSRDIIKHYVTLDNRIRPFFIEKKGIANAVNFGGRKAKYDWIARMDADDISLPERFQIQMEFISRKTELAALGSYGYYMDESGKRILGKIKIGPTSFKEYYDLVKNDKLIFILNPSMIINKRIFLEVGGYREIPVLEDLDFNCRLADKKYPMLVIPKYLVKQRKIYSSETSSKFFLLQNTMRWIKFSMLKRRKGEKEISLEEYLEMLKKESFLKRFNRYRKDRGAYFLKKAGLSLSYRRYADFLPSFLISFLLSPDYALKKIKRVI